MNKEYSKHHVQVPNDMLDDGLVPRDILVYICLKRFDSSKHTVFPSLKRLAELSGLTVNTVRKSIEALVLTGYITIKIIGRKHFYFFTLKSKFQPMSYDFLDNPNLDSTEKAFIAAMQQYMYTDIEGYGKVSYTNEEIAKKLNISEKSVRNIQKSLEKKSYLVTVKNRSVDLVTKCSKTTKIFNLEKLGQAIIWKLGEHEQAIQKHDKELDQINNKILELEKRLEEQKLIIKALFEQNSKLIQNSNNKFTL